VQDIRNYIKRGKLWEAFDRAAPPVLLIDEIDKADIEFPNDLLRELDRMEFYVYETRRARCGEAPADHHHHQQQREGTAGRLPAPLLLPLHPLPRSRDDGAHRRVHYPGIKQDCCRGARAFLRDARGAGPEEEALDLGAARLDQAAGGRGHPARGAAQRRPAKAIPPLHGALLKNEQDVHLFERLVFMQRRAAARAPCCGFFFELRAPACRSRLREYLLTCSRR
jgi:hypothetical protein